MRPRISSKPAGLAFAKSWSRFLRPLGSRRLKAKLNMSNERGHQFLLVLLAKKRVTPHQYRTCLAARPCLRSRGGASSNSLVSSSLAGVLAVG